MAKISLIKSPEDLERERAEKEKARAAEIQASIEERHRKIQALHAKQVRNKIIIFSIAGALTVILIIFGTYNTFFKQGLSMNDVNMAISQARYTDVYPDAGLDNYVRDNCESLFNKYMQLDIKKGGKNIQNITVDKDSCYITKVTKISPTLATVVFGVDISTTEKDSLVTDPVIIEQLKRSGFGVDPNKIYKVNQTTIIEQPTTEESSETEEVNETEETTTEETTEKEVVTATVDINNAVTVVSGSEGADTASETEETEEYIPITDVEYSISQTGEHEHYYMTANGQIMKEGRTVTERYYFSLPVQIVYGYDADGKTPITAGYAPASAMNLYSLVDTNQTDFENIQTNDLFAFNDDYKLDVDTTNKMQIKVNNTLKALYDGLDTSQDFLNYRAFNSYNSNYVGINEFKAFSQPNGMGYNCWVSYTIVTSQGFNYTLETYLKVEQNGGTWVIKGIY